MPAKSAVPAVTDAVPNQRAFWDRWHQEHSVASHVAHSKAAFGAFVDALPKQSDSSVLELGCGQGREAVSFAQQGLQVSALDHSTVAIRTARTEAHRRGLHIDFRQHDLSSPPFPYGPGAFDGVFSHLSLHYFDDYTTRRIFSEIERLLKPLGVLYFTARSIQDPLYGQGDPIGKDMYCRNGHVRHFFHEEYVRAMLTSWDIKYAEYYGPGDQEVNPGVFMRVLACAPGDWN